MNSIKSSTRYCSLTYVLVVSLFLGLNTELGGANGLAQASSNQLHLEALER